MYSRSYFYLLHLFLCYSKPHDDITSDEERYISSLFYNIPPVLCSSESPCSIVGEAGSVTESVSDNYCLVGGFSPFLTPLTAIFPNLKKIVWSFPASILMVIISWPLPASLFPKIVQFSVLSPLMMDLHRGQQFLVILSGASWEEDCHEMCFRNLIRAPHNFHPFQLSSWELERGGNFSTTWISYCAVVTSHWIWCIKMFNWKCFTNRGGKISSQDLYNY